MRHVFGQRWYTTVWHTSLSALISFAAEGRIQNHSEKVEWHTCIYIYIIMLSYIHKIYMPHVFTHTIKRKSTFMTDAIVIHIETQ